MKGFYKTLTCTHFLITEDVFVIVQSILSRFIWFLTFYVACYSFLYSVLPSGIMKNPFSISFPIYMSDGDKFCQFYFSEYTLLGLYFSRILLLGIEV